MEQTEIKLTVPYISQLRDVKDEEWRHRSCSIACLAMAINYFKKDLDLDVNNLLADAKEFHFYNDNFDWIHYRIVLLPHNYGVSSYAEEFRSKRLGIPTSFEISMRKKGIEKIINHIKNNRLVIFSMPKEWNPDNHYHNSIIVGLKFKEGEENEVSGFYYHDPNFENESIGGYKFIDIDTFNIHWRGLAMFIG